MPEPVLDAPRAARRQAERRARHVRRGARGAIAVVVVVGGGLLAVNAVHAGEALPGTTLAGADVGGLQRDELRALVADRVRRPLLVRAGARTLVLDRAETGLRVDLDATVDRALDAGRSTPLSGVTAYVTSREVPLERRIDARRLRAAVAEVAGRFDRRTFTGTLTIDPETLQVGTQRPRDGRAVQRERLTERLQAALTTGARIVEVPIATREGIDPDRVRDAAQRARARLRASVTVRAAGQQVTLAPKQLAPALALTERGTLGVDREGLDGLVAAVAEEIDRPARDAKVTAPARPAVVEGKGDLAWRPREADVTVRPSRNGRLLDRARARRRLADALRDPATTDVSLTTSAARPKVPTGAARRISDLLGTFTTRYEAGQPRVTNIRRIAEEADGTLVPAGGQFSLNAITGPRTEGGGYVEAPFIADDKIVPSIGGGVSQFSTTMYNAAYFAGLRLDAHRAHSLFIDRYPAGRESTLNFPDIDLRWTNDTGAPVLVRTASDATSVTVSLFGRSDGRRVSAHHGERRPVDGGDFRITVTRTIRYESGTVVRQPQTTVYRKPRDDKE